MTYTAEQYAERMGRFSDAQKALIEERGFDWEVLDATKASMIADAERCERLAIDHPELSRLHLGDAAAYRNLATALEA